MLPAASRATALSVCGPFVAVAVFHATLYGELVSSAARLAPSSLNCTPLTPTLSAALAVTLIEPWTVAPLAGAVIETVGLVRSLLTVTLMVVAVVVLPAASRATALSVCGAVGRGRSCSRRRCRGSWCPRRRGPGPSSLNCTPLTPTLSAALAVTLIVACTGAPSAGAVSDTVGAIASGLATVTLTVVAVLVLPAASRATAVSACAPFVAVEVFQGTE